jgi:hypothetical protein
MPPPEGLAEAIDTSTGVSPFLKHLAAYSRGIPGVALALWRSALRNDPDEKVAETQEAQATCELGTSIWVLPWDEVQKPALPRTFDPGHALLLHALLVHHGLTAGAAAELLSFSADAVERAGSELQEAGLIENNGGCWRVPAADYSAARRYLDGEGYFTDDF